MNLKHRSWDKEHRDVYLIVIQVLQYPSYKCYEPFFEGRQRNACLKNVIWQLYLISYLLHVQYLTLFYNAN